MAKTRGQDAFRPIGSVSLLLLQLLSGAIPGNGRKADFEVLGPSEPVWAMVGGNVDLPCYLSPNISAEDMELRWYRDQPSPAVHVRRKGKDVPEEQMALYQGRTTFLKDGVAQGQASVRIHNVTTFDNGTFHCQFNDSTVSAEATLWLRVADPASRWFRSTAWKIALPLILVAALLGVATIISLLWTPRRA
ncbi:butyrophilin-like protein 10 isoform X2 [Equus asinus]|uniref:butyrophilin-like protein 10 isoform X2 n=1 Tax=Equus asinus TaxID=9793 RepID=UPI0038F7658F